jgi:hypothetical protein
MYFAHLCTGASGAFFAVSTLAAPIQLNSKAYHYPITLIKPKYAYHQRTKLGRSTQHSATDDSATDDSATDDSATDDSATYP